MFFIKTTNIFLLIAFSWCVNSMQLIGASSAYKTHGITEKTKGSLRQVFWLPVYVQSTINQHIPVKK